ncbi:hypothetical protein J132_08998 [Termitomyces sp. J132]|nr:hypothetical protein J132_08998 [Termitomyces sp. J132]
MPVIPHTPWVLKDIPIAPGLCDKICKMIKQKIEAGVYEPSNSSYCSQWFTVLKKDGESLHIVHSLEPLNKVTIAHSGLPPATEKLASHFAGHACSGIFDLYIDNVPIRGPQLYKVLGLNLPAYQDVSQNLEDEKFAEEHKYSIKDFKFKPLDLVLVKNMITESLLSAKMLPWFHGPIVVLTRTQGGNYVVAEMDGMVWQERVAVFRVVPYHTRKQLSLPGGIEEWIDMTPAKLKELQKEQQKATKLEDQDITFGSVRLHEPMNSELGIMSEEESEQEEPQLVKRVKKPSCKVREINKS